MKETKSLWEQKNKTLVSISTRNESLECKKPNTWKGQLFIFFAIKTKFEILQYVSQHIGEFHFKAIFFNMVVDLKKEYI